MTRLRRLWDQDRPALNAWCSIGNPFVAEIMAAQGFDSVTVDMQHGALDYADLLPMLQAMRASGATLLARVPWLDPAHVMKGAGRRGRGDHLPDGQHRRGGRPLRQLHALSAAGPAQLRPDPRHLRPRAGLCRKRQRPPSGRLPMVETAEALSNLDAIVSTPGLDGIYVSPADLTQSVSQGRLPFGMDRQEPEMIAEIRRIAEACRKRGIIAALHCGTPDYAHRAIGWGFRMTTVGGDSASSRRQRRRRWPGSGA